MQATSSSFTWDPTFNQLQSFTNPLGNTTTYTFDASGNLIRTTDPLGNSYQITPDPQGRPVAIKDPLGRISVMNYDGPDLRHITDPLNPSTHLLTDTLGRLLAHVDPLGNRTLFDWDALDRLTQRTNPLGDTIKFTYDANGFLKTQTDERGNTAASYTYNGTGQVTAIKDALNQIETRSYDSAGRLARRIDRKGQLASITRSQRSHVFKLNYSPTAVSSKTPTPSAACSPTLIPWATALCSTGTPSTV